MAESPEKFLGPLKLAHGKHDRGTAMCAMEAAAYLAGEPHSDHPLCVSPVIATFCRSWNDSLPDADRTRLLKPFIPKVLFTRTSDADEVTRAWLATDWLARVHAPAFLDLTPSLKVHATALRNLPPLTCSEIALASQQVLSTAYSAAYSAADSAAVSAARSAIDSAADSALAPVVSALQESACDLLDRMIAVGTCTEPPCHPVDNRLSRDTAVRETVTHA